MGLEKFALGEERVDMLLLLLGCLDSGWLGLDLRMTALLVLFANWLGDLVPKFKRVSPNGDDGLRQCHI